MAKKKRTIPSDKKDEICKKIDNNEQREIKVIKKKYSNTWYNKLILVFTFISGIIYFACSLYKGNNIIDIFNGLLILVFTLLLVYIFLSCPNRKNGLTFLTVLLLFVYQCVGVSSLLELVNFDSNKMKDFTNSSLTEVIKWTQNNKISLNQEFEYSDMVEEYHIISQNIKPGTKLKGISNLTVAISEGPSPYKEVVIPNMIDWDTDSVLAFIRENHLSNVSVEFISSDKKENTLIEQSVTGNLKRCDELKLVFSYGVERSYSEVKLNNLINMSKFEAEFYLKQYGINYELAYDFSKDISRGNVMGQSIKAGEGVSINSEDKLIITISKGPEIKVVDLENMSVSEITDWVVKNKLRLELKSKYDDTKKENEVIGANYKKGDVIEQGTAIIVTVSKGSLKMPHFENLSDFRKWAEENQISYEEQYEFNDEVDAGEVISYSHDKGSVVKNGETIIVKISDGKKIEVPNLKGLSKSEIINKMKNSGLKYNFVYKNSSSVAKDKAISQSISAGSEVSEGTTITITLSNGKSSTQNRTETPSNGGGSSNNTPPPAPTCDKSKGDSLNIQAGSSGEQTKTMIQQMNPNHKFSWNMVSACPNGDTTPGNVCTTGLEGVWKNFCDSISVTIIK